MKLKALNLVITLFRGSRFNSGTPIRPLLNVDITYMASGHILPWLSCWITTKSTTPPCLVSSHHHLGRRGGQGEGQICPKLPERQKHRIPMVCHHHHHLTILFGEELGSVRLPVNSFSEWPIVCQRINSWLTNLLAHNRCHYEPEWRRHERPKDLREIRI